MIKNLVFALFGSVVLTINVAAKPGDEVPQWLQQAASLTNPPYDRDVPAVILRNEQAVSVDSDGKVTTVTRFAVRVLTREGRGFASASEPYLTKAGRVKELHAWLIRSNGSVRKFGNDDTLDQMSDPNDIYNEYRVKIIDGAREADAGSVFGFESSSEEHPLFGQDIWRFQNRLPSLASRYTLTLPNGWSATSITFNHTKIEPTTSGSNYTWELQNLSPVRPEPSSPSTSSLVPIIAISYFPADSGLTKNSNVFETWSQVSRWATQLHDPQVIPDATVTAKAKELTANAKTELDKIKAIGRFVQSLQYISIDIGVGRGNGYRPHAAPLVLSKAYGDCKDKANLMRSMLKAIDITAYPVAIYLGDPTYVRAEWASPLQFNHCIIAVKISDETKVPSVIQHPTFGRLLIFDATDEHTPVGDLPNVEQDSYALIIAGDAGTLERMPSLPPESSVLTREAEVTLDEYGSITAVVKERFTGQAAVAARREFKSLSSAEYRDVIEDWVSRGATAAKVSKLVPNDETNDGRFELDVEFSVDRYGQLMQNRLLVFKPAIVSRREALSLTEATRQAPIVLSPRSFTETAHFKLPAGFDVDELPDPVKLDAAFGSYQTTYEVKSGELIFKRALSQKSSVIPASDYQKVRSFYEKMRAAEQAPVVLARK
ncbi:MAG: hypothetical protein C5B55_02225 [Blastocatellia bacterium]|nr:MAG: hypothetical protein C5B55_02225 [Blastocatellia bacterium]